MTPRHQVRIELHLGYYAACTIGPVDPAEGIKPIWG
jgi:hypothetical protein